MATRAGDRWQAGPVRIRGGRGCHGRRGEVGGTPIRGSPAGGAAIARFPSALLRHSRLTRTCLPGGSKDRGCQDAIGGRSRDIVPTSYPCRTRGQEHGFFRAQAAPPGADRGGEGVREAEAPPQRSLGLWQVVFRPDWREVGGGRGGTAASQEREPAGQRRVNWNNCQPLAICSPCCARLQLARPEGRRDHGRVAGESDGRWVVPGGGEPLAEAFSSGSGSHERWDKRGGSGRRFRWIWPRARAARLHRWLRRSSRSSARSRGHAASASR